MTNKDKNDMLIWAVRYNAVEVVRHFAALEIDEAVLLKCIEGCDDEIVLTLLKGALNES